MRAPLQPELLRDAYEAAEDAAGFDAAHREAVAAVTDWRYASDDLSFLDPFRKERFHESLQWRKPGAKPRKNDLLHGLDAEGRIRVVQTQAGEPVAHLVHHDSRSVRFDRTPSVRRYDFCDHGRLSAEFILYPGHGLQAEYHWEEEILRAVESIGWNQPYKSPRTSWGEISVTFHILAEYDHDDAGLLRITNRYMDANGVPEPKDRGLIEYQRIPKGVSAPGLAKEIAELMVRETPVLVRGAANPNSTYYALLLCYCAEDPSAGWPPFLLLANESTLQRPYESEQDRIYFAWAPDELREMDVNTEIPFRDEQFLEKCRLHMEIMAAKGLASMKRALAETVAALQNVNWPEIIRVTDDFVIAAVDNTGEVDPAKDIAKYAPEAFKNLRRRGLI